MCAVSQGTCAVSQGTCVLSQGTCIVSQCTQGKCVVPQGTCVMSWSRVSIYVCLFWQKLQVRSLVVGQDEMHIHAHTYAHVRACVRVCVRVWSVVRPDTPVWRRCRCVTWSCCVCGACVKVWPERASGPLLRTPASSSGASGRRWRQRRCESEK